MRMSFVQRARLAAGAFLFLAAGVAQSARVEVAAPRPDGTCPRGGPPWGLQSLPLGSSAAGGCVTVFRPADLSDATLDRASSALAESHLLPALVFDFRAVPAAQATPERVAFAIKRIASAARSGSPGLKVALDFAAEQNRRLDSAFFAENGPYWDAVVWRAGRGPVATGDEVPPYWLIAAGAEGEDPVNALLRAAGSVPDEARHFELLILETPARSGWEALTRFQRYWAEGLGMERTEIRATAADGKEIPLLASLEPKALTPILFLPQEASTSAHLQLEGGPFAKASVENLATGAKRDFEIKGAPRLDLDLSKGALAVVLQPAVRPGGETRTAVEVGATRGLTAEEIVARERVWDAGQREKVKTFRADAKASLRFRIGEVNETFDLTIEGPFFFERGRPADWAWQQFYLNGVKWKGKTLPKLPILQPEKVTTLPLDIRLTEDYDYAIHGEATVSGRRTYHLTFAPKTTTGDKPIYRGSVWIDKETFALLRRDSVQLNLKGETLSNVQTEYYRPVPGQPDVLLPLEIKGQQVFSTAGRTTAIERDVTMESVRVNPADFESVREAAYASQAQMIRDTEQGMRYLVPDAAHPGQRIVEEKVSKKSTFGLLGAFYDNALDYPIPLLGVQHFNFDLFGTGKQLSVFFGGALLTTNYTDPSLAGSRFDLGADLFAVAIAFGDTAYRNGQEVLGEKIKHLPAVFQVNVGHPLGPYLKGSVSLVEKWDNFQRDKETAPDFVTPQDTLTEGVEGKLVGNFRGFNATLTGGYFHRNHWTFWGIPGNSEFDPSQKDYWKYSLTVSKDQYFRGFRKLHASVGYLGGSRLDRFSQYEFGTFSGNPMRGYSSGSVRVEKAFIANVSYGLNIEDIIRFEGFYDQALATQRVAGYHNTYFSGAGLLASLNGPWQNSLLRGEIGVPVVSHGIHGFVVNVLLLKLF